MHLQCDKPIPRSQISTTSMLQADRDRGRGRSCIRTPSTASTTSISLLHHAPRRATSHHIQSNVDHKTNEDLRHTALRKGLSRTSSASTIETIDASNSRSKHVAAVPPMRHGENRWSGFSIAQQLQPQTQPDADKKPKASISPLTQMHTATNLPSDHPYTVQRREQEHMGQERILDRSNFQRGRLDRNGSHRSQIELVLNHTDNTSRLDSVAKPSREDHNSMFSLVPMSRSHTESDDSMDDPGPEPQRGVFANYDNDDFDASLENVTSMLDFMEEVSSSRPKVPTDTYRSTRTHQKILQMKDFLQDESSGENAPPGGPLFGNSFDYAVKIQHESLLSQWDLVRLRFSSHSNRKDRTTVTCLAGVLGLVQRLKRRGIERRPREESGEMVTRDTLADYLQSLWQDDEPTDDYRAEDDDIYQDQRETGNLARNVVFSPS